jgi:hypothetical protein
MGSLPLVFDLTFFWFLEKDILYVFFFPYLKIRVHFLLSLMNHLVFGKQITMGPMHVTSLHHNCHVMFLFELSLRA